MGRVAVRDLKIKAASENRRLREVVAEVLGHGLAEGSRPTQAHRVSLPLVHSTRSAPAGHDLTADLVAEIFDDEDVAYARDRRS